MATKATNKKKTVAKATPATVLNSKPQAKFSAFPMDGNVFAQAFPQFQSFKLETDMFKGNKQFDKITQDAAAIGQDQMDAVSKAATIFAKGMEDIVKTYMEIMQSAGEKSQSATKTIMSCKTLNEFTDAQTRLAQSSYDEFLANATKISEKSVKLCTDALEPINDQLGRSIKRATNIAA